MQRAGKLFVVLSVVAALFPLSIAIAPHAAAAPACTYDDGTDTVAAIDDSVASIGEIFTTAAGEIKLFMQPGSNTISCTDGVTNATVTNTDKISIQQTGTGSTTWTLNLNPNAYAPGATTEASGVAEIEFEVDLGAGIDDSLFINNTEPGVDNVFRFGNDGINLNDDDDVDVTGPGGTGLPSGVEKWQAVTGDDVDVMSGRGSGATGSAPFPNAITLVSLGGTDTLEDGAGADTLKAGNDNDQLHISADTNSDLADGEDGDDSVAYAQTSADLTVTLDSAANDGDPAANTGAGENDNVFDIENVTTSDGDDDVTGNGQGNTLNGGDGDDRLVGGFGEDLLNGGDDGDTLIAGPDGDSLNGGAGADTLDGGTEGDQLDGGSGTDTADYSDSPDGVSIDITNQLAAGGDAEGDFLVEISNTSTLENITGSSDDDFLRGDARANRLNGGNGDDQIEGMALGDTLDGGAGVDIVDYLMSPGLVVVDLTSDTASGVSGHATLDTLVPNSFESVYGSSLDDTLTGDGNDNELRGSFGDDKLAGLGGADTLDGGDHGPVGDTLDYSASTAGVSVNLTTSVVSGGDAAGDVITDNENVIGSDSNDTVTGDADANALNGGFGNDSIAGLAGADNLDGGFGIDVLNYSASTATVVVNLANGAASGGHAQDDIVAGNTFENVTGSAFADRLFGSGANNTLSGGSGTDQLRGGLGADMLRGGSGIDTVLYNDKTARVIADPTSAGDDGTSGEADTIAGDVENITGGRGSDTLGGSTRANKLVGGAGRDLLRGLGGNDTLLGGTNIDIARGGVGRDRCVAETETTCEV